MKNFKIGAGYCLVIEVEIGHYEEHLCTVTNRTATTIYFNNKPYRYNVTIDAKSGSEYVRLGNSEDAPAIYARDEIYSAEETATVVNQTSTNAVIAPTENKPIKFELQKFATNAPKKFKISGVYKTNLSPTLAYTLQVYDRSESFLKVRLQDQSIRRKIHVDQNGVEYINVSGYAGRRALIFKADAEVELREISPDIVEAVKAIFGIPTENVTAEYIAEDDGSNDDYDEDEIITVENTVNDNEEDDDELVDPPEITPQDKPSSSKTLDFGTSKTSYHVLALAGGKVLTFDGKRISKEKAATEIVCACNKSRVNPHKNYANFHDVLLIDDKAYKYVKKFALHISFGDNEFTDVFNSYIDSKNIKFVDFGRDEIPYINEKVEAIVASYKKHAKEVDAAIAAGKAYRASPKYMFDGYNTFIAECENRIAEYRRKIHIRTRHIIEWLSSIADEENIINSYGIEISELEKQIEKARQNQKPFADEIATLNAFKAINAAAAELIDDGSNDDDFDEDEIITVDNAANDKDDDDELVDPPQSFCELILDALNIQNNAVCATQPFTFNLQFFTATDNNANNLATLDTSVTLAATPMRDIVAELDTVVNNRKAFQKAIRSNRQRIKHFENEIFKAELMIKQARRMIEHHSKNIGNLQEAIVECENVITRELPIEILTETADKIAAEFSKIPYKDSTEELMKIVAVDGTNHSLPCNFGALQMTTLHGKVVVMLGNNVLGSYFTSAELETAMQGLMQAIQQGANEYIFPE